MQRKTLVVVVAIVLALGAVTVLRGSAWYGRHVGEGFAVVELYTSQGCSSCPPAEALMERTQQRDRDLPVYCLAFHVDYWDRDGWKDVFSSSAYTDRQRQYARWLKKSQLYTPQVVVNGTTEFLGSDGAAMSKAIGAGLEQEGGPTLTISGLQLHSGHLNWQYAVKGNTGTAGHLSLVAVIVEKHAVTQVRGGENKGRTLSHVQIVRSLGMQTPDAAGSGSGQLDWPAGLSEADGELIAFLQDQDNGKIIAATREHL